jgi:hypothetical protein
MFSEHFGVKKLIEFVEERDRIEEHTKGCRICDGRLQSIEFLQEVRGKELNEASFSAECPVGYWELRDWLHGAIAEPMEREKVLEHVKSCWKCTRELLSIAEWEKSGGFPRELVEIRSEEVKGLRHVGIAESVASGPISATDSTPADDPRGQDSSVASAPLRQSSKDVQSTGYRNKDRRKRLSLHYAGKSWQALSKHKSAVAMVFLALVFSVGFYSLYSKVREHNNVIGELRSQVELQEETIKGFQNRIIEAEFRRLEIEALKGLKGKSASDGFGLSEM